MEDSEAGPEGLELEGYQVETKSKAAQTKFKEPIRRTGAHARILEHPPRT